MKKLYSDVPFSNKKKEESLVDLTSQVSNLNSSLAQKVSYPILIGEVGVVNVNIEYGDVRRYGAVKPTRNEVVNDAPFFQNAIDSAFALGTSVKVTTGIYTIKTTLLLPRNITIIGTGNKVSYRGQTDGTVIESEVLELFAPKSDINVTLKMENLYFWSKYSLEYDTCFSGFNFLNSIIKGCNFHEFDIVLLGGWGGGMGNFYENDCQNIGKYFYKQTPPIGSGLRSNGVSGIIDGYITNNYINGNPAKNPTAFYLEQFASSYISKNYIDFFKIAIYLQFSGDSCFIKENTIDICYRGIMGRVSGVNIIDNTFMHIHKSYVNRFINATSKMLNTDWICISNGNANDYENGNTDDFLYMNKLLVANNYVNTTNLFFFTQGYLKNGTKVLKQTYVNCDKNTDFTASVGWNSSPEDSLMDVFIDDMMYQSFATLPNASITTGNCKTFNNHIIRYNGKLLINNAGTWNDLMGNVVSA
jgi:hypothetical protein